MRIIFLLGLAILSLSIHSSESDFTTRAGQDYALFFAINDYDHLDNLNNPIQNARDIALELEKSYGFKTEVIENPTLDEIDAKIAAYQRKFSNGTFAATGQLFVYFSGHGIKTANNGYFMAKDSDPDRPNRNGMEYDYYREKIDNINCQHILVTIDACHSATFDPSYGSRNDGRRFYRPGERYFDRILGNHQAYQARCFWTSDGKGEQTPDKSDFAYYLLEGLRSHQSNTDYLRSSELFATYLEKASPKPDGGHFGQDEPNACFLFFKPKRIIEETTWSDRTAYEQALAQNTIRAYRQYQADYPNGDFAGAVEQKISILEEKAYKERELLDWEEAKSLNTRKAYHDFIDKNPNSIYVAAADLNKENLSTVVSSNAAIAIHVDLVFIKGDIFQMGSDDGYSFEKPIHTVTVPDFYIGKYEVTQKQWHDVVGKDSYDLYFKGCDNCPVENVSRIDIQYFLTRLNQQTGRTYRLPTEAEWEYAARGGRQSKGYKYAGSNNLKEVAWYFENSTDLGSENENNGTNPVGQKKANELGLYDMSGNVYEWCEDNWHRNYNKAPKNGSAWKEYPRGSFGVSRGGSWGYNARHCRITKRASSRFEARNSLLGFRLAHSL